MQGHSDFCVAGEVELAAKYFPRRAAAYEAAANERAKMGAGRMQRGKDEHESIRGSGEAEPRSILFLSTFVAEKIFCQGASRDRLLSDGIRAQDSSRQSSCAMQIFLTAILDGAKH